MRFIVAQRTDIKENSSRDWAICPACVTCAHDAPTAPASRAGPLGRTIAGRRENSASCRNRITIARTTAHARVVGRRADMSPEETGFSSRLAGGYRVEL